MRRNQQPTAWLAQSGSALAASCLACPDSPCMRLDPIHDEHDTRDSGSTPEYDLVCPSDSLNLSFDGKPRVDESLCVQCGVCATRCPVGAIYISPDGAVVRTDTSEQLASDERAFYEAREALAQSLWFQFPDRNQELVEQCLRSLESIRVLDNPAPAVRSLVQSVFRTFGIPVRIRRVGDTNAPAEFWANSKSSVLTIELQPNGDEISGVRRLLAATARLASRYRLDVKEVIPVLVLNALPNRRSGLYELLSDVESRLAIRIRVTTISMLIALANNPSADMSFYLANGWNVSSRTNSLQRDFPSGETLRDSHAYALGILPAK